MIQCGVCGNHIAIHEAEIIQEIHVCPPCATAWKADIKTCGHLWETFDEQTQWMQCKKCGAGKLPEELS